jgi:hypothetical protein
MVKPRSSRIRPATSGMTVRSSGRVQSEQFTLVVCEAPAWFAVVCEVACDADDDGAVQPVSAREDGASRPHRRAGNRISGVRQPAEILDLK